MPRRAGWLLGIIVHHFGYSATFLAAAVALALFALWMLETAETKTAAES